MTSVRLTAPANKVLTVLHIVDAAAPWVTDVKGSESTTGSTKCGIAMRTVDCWQLLEQLPGDRICSRCTGEGGGAEGEQEMLL